MCDYCTSENFWNVFVQPSKVKDYCWWYTTICKKCVKNIKEFPNHNYIVFTKQSPDEFGIIKYIRKKFLCAE